jgi:hypothetical protein
MRISGDDTKTGAQPLWVKKLKEAPIKLTCACSLFIGNVVAALCHKWKRENTGAREHVLPERKSRRSFFFLLLTLIIISF